MSCPSVPSDRTVAYRAVQYRTSIAYSRLACCIHRVSTVCVCVLLSNFSNTHTCSVDPACLAFQGAGQNASLAYRTASHAYNHHLLALHFSPAMSKTWTDRRPQPAAPLAPRLSPLPASLGWPGADTQQQAASSTVKKETPLKIVIIPYVPFFTSTQNCAASETTTVLQTRYYCTLNLALHYRTQ